MAQLLIDGKAISAQIKDELKEKVAAMKEQGVEVTLAVILGAWYIHLYLRDMTSVMSCERKKMFKDCFALMQVTGEENFPKEDGFLMCGNHQGLFDILAIAAAYPRPLAAVLKKELKDIPFLKQIIKCTGSYPMDREDVRESMKVILAVSEELKNGRTFLIFPEGTRSKKGNEMLEFHHGTFKCVTKSQCPILPFALIDSFKVLDQKNAKAVTVQLHFLEPIFYEEYKDLKTNEIAAMVQARVQAAIDKNT